MDGCVNPWTAVDFRCSVPGHEANSNGGGAAVAVDGGGGGAQVAAVAFHGVRADPAGRAPVGEAGRGAAGAGGGAPGVRAGVEAVTGPDAREEYVPVPIAPDPARDARVAARRAEDAAKAGRALDNLLRSQGAMYRNRVAAGERFIEELGDYLVSRLQHNRHYGVAPCGHGCSEGDNCAGPASEGSCRP